VVALDLTATDPTAARATIESLRILVQEELRSDLSDESPRTTKTDPSPESGDLGFTVGSALSPMTSWARTPVSGRRISTDPVGQARRLPRRHNQRLPGRADLL
jgi:hypothetical protein